MEHGAGGRRRRHIHSERKADRFVRHVETHHHHPAGENGAPISRVCETYAVTRNGNLCTSRIEGYGTDYARETTYEYTGMGKIAKETAPDGSVKTWAYDRFGREIVSSVPWAEAGDKVTYTTYRDQTQADPDILTQWVTLTATAAELWRADYTYVEENHVRRVEKRTTALGKKTCVWK